MLSGVSSAQENATISGYVKDAADGEALPYVNIVVPTLEVGTTANEYGYYALRLPPGVHEVTFSLIYKGGIPARYGGRLSSVLDVRQKEGNAKRASGQVGIGLLSGRMLLEGPLADGRGSYIVAGRRSYGDLIFQALSSNSSTAHFYDVNFKANYNLDANNRLFISGYRGRDALELEELLDNSWGNTTATIRWNRLFSGHLYRDCTATGYLAAQRAIPQTPDCRPSCSWLFPQFPRQYL